MRSLIFLYTTIICSAVLLLTISCGNKRFSSEEPGRSSLAYPFIGKENTDSVAAPLVTVLTQETTPQPVPAGKPAIIYLDTFDVPGKHYFKQVVSSNGKYYTSSVRSLLTDRDGFLWIGTTEGGVAKYDGHSFKKYGINDGLVFPYAITGILQDKKGDIWIIALASTDDIKGNIVRFDGKDFTYFPELDNKAIRWAYINGQGNISVVGGSGYFSYNGKNFYPEKIEGITHSRFTRIVEDSKGKLWISGEKGNGLWVVEKNKVVQHFTPSDLPPIEGGVRYIKEDSKRRVWIVGGNGVLYYDGSSFSKIVLKNMIVVQIFEDRKGDMWFCTASGLYKCDGDNINNIRQVGQEMHPLVSSITQDSAGTYWIGTYAGLIQYDGGMFTTFTKKEKIPSDTVWSIVNDREGNVWMGHDASDAIHGGITKYDGKKFVNYNGKHGLATNVVSCIMLDSKNKLWITGLGGFSIFDGNSFVNYTGNALPEVLRSRNIRSIVEDKEGYYWLASNEGSLHKFDGKSFFEYTTAQGLPSKSIYGLLIDKKGSLWLSSDKGLSRYNNTTGRFINFSTKEGLVGNIIYCILEDVKGRIWMGTESGLSVMENDSIRNFVYEDGLADNAVYTLTFDEKHNVLWVGTDNGFSRLNISEYEKAKGTEAIFLNFNLETGYPVFSPNTNTSKIDKNGHLWTGDGYEKVVRFDPLNLDKKQTVIINRILLNNERLAWSIFDKRNNDAGFIPSQTDIQQTYGKLLHSVELSAIQRRYTGLSYDSLSPFNFLPQNLVLPYKYNTITFSFATIIPSLAKLAKYSYTLEGYEEKWSTVDKANTAHYSGLPHGHYTFRVKVLSISGEWSETSYSFTIKAPWWLSWWAFILYGVMLIGVGLLVYRYVRMRLLQQEREQARIKELEQAREIEKAYKELKATQDQLVQSEKMASLGELTAGIAHEIQNPLNFVNNFSEVSNELIDEMIEEVDRNNFNDVKIIAGDLKQNLEKINYHGKRADGIVKGMLQHSRISTGQKELTDINLLADEYLRLSYHGLRAKDKTFNAKFETAFDTSLPKISVVPQDIGRVLLNLINNAFYAVTERKKQLGESFQPTVLVTTKRLRNEVEIVVEDNGNGIPKQVIEKIFLPFFTTKPSGKGTGLGLSLSYDIVRAHGGDIRVENAPESGAKFIIHLPV